MSLKSTPIILSICILAGASIYSMMAHRKEEMKAVHNDTEPVSKAVDPASEKNDSYDLMAEKEERREQRRRRMDAMAELMKLYAMRIENEEDEKRLQKLLEETKIPEEEAQRISIRNETISAHVWSEGASVFDSMISEQEKNIDWTEEMEDTFQNMLEENKLQASEMTESDCYETLCKLVFTHQDDAALDIFKNAAAGNTIVGPSRAFVVDRGDGSIETTVYLAREGDDDLLHEEMYDRLYEKVAGHSVDEIALNQNVPENQN